MLFLFVYLKWRVHIEILPWVNRKLLVFIIFIHLPPFSFKAKCGFLLFCFLLSNPLFICFLKPVTTPIFVKYWSQKRRIHEKSRKKPARKKTPNNQSKKLNKKENKKKKKLSWTTEFFLDGVGVFVTLATSLSKIKYDCAANLL